MNITKEKNESWIEHVSKNMLNKSDQSYANIIKVHPCVINNENTLLHEKNLENKDPESFEKLNSYAHVNNFKLKEDERVATENVERERRETKSIPMLILASSIFMPGMCSANDIGLTDSDIKVLPDIEVTANIDNSEQYASLAYSYKTDFNDTVNSLIDSINTADNNSLHVNDLGKNN